MCDERDLNRPSLARRVSVGAPRRAIEWRTVGSPLSAQGVRPVIRDRKEFWSCRDRSCHELRCRSCHRRMNGPCRAGISRAHHRGLTSSAEGADLAGRNAGRHCAAGRALQSAIRGLTPERLRALAAARLIRSTQTSVVRGAASRVGSTAGQASRGARGKAIRGLTHPGYMLPPLRG